MRGVEGRFGGKLPVPLAYILALPASLDQPNWVFYFSFRLKIYAQPRAAMLEPKYWCKQVKARSGWWCVIAGSHPVDGWPCDNLTHQPPSPLCVQLHKRINKRSRINSRPVASKTEQGGSRTAQNAAVSVIAVCHCLYIYIMLCRPDFNNLQLEGRVSFSQNCPIVFLHYSLVGWNMDMSPWQSPYLVFCLHAVMRQAFPSPGITTISRLSWPCTSSWTFGHTIHL